MNDISRIFRQWPAAIPRHATVLTTFGESIPFVDYLLTDELVLLVRPRPDVQGTRRLIVKLADVQAIRFHEEIEPERFTVMGFQRHTAAMVG